MAPTCLLHFNIPLTDGRLPLSPMPKLYTLLFFLIPVSALAQSSLTGRIMNERGEPIPFASIRLNRNGIGTLTNEEGRFLLNWSHQRDTDSVSFSCMGFQEQRFAVAGLRTRPVTITMQPAPALLEGVTVTATTAPELVKRAIRKIPDNYYQTPVITHGFYRIHTKKGDEHLMLSEAVFDIYNPGYSSSADNKFHLVQMRSVQDEQGSQGIDLGMKPKALYKYDIVRDLASSSLLDEAGLKKHQFRYLKRTMLNGKRVYQVAFDQRDGLKESLFAGVLFIDEETEAFAGFKIGRSPKGIAYARYGTGADRTLLKLMGMEIGILRDDLLIQYQPMDGKWVLASVQNSNELRFTNKRRKYDFTADIKVDYLVTGVDTGGIAAFATNDKLGDHRFIEYQNNAFVRDFWKDYNILLADYNSDTIAAAIERKNQQGRLKNQLLARWKKMPADPATCIDSIMSTYHRNGLFSGTVLVKHKGLAVQTKGYGLANEESGVPNDVQTRYRIGSLSKTFTAMLIMQLVQEGACQLTDTIGRYLPGYVHGGITIAQLLCHSSGIPSYSRSPIALAAMVQKEYPVSALIRQYGSDPLEFIPGTAFRYSNTGYLLLAGIIEQITHKPLKAVLEERLFQPLGFSHTAFADTAIHSRGYWMGAPEQPYPLSNMAGAGGISSTVTDLERWAQAVSTHQLISRSLTDTLLAPRFSYGDWDASYAYGWMIDQHAFSVSDKYRVIYHPGTDLGYYTMFVMIPETETLIVLLSNHGDFPRYDLTNLIMKSLIK